MDGIKVLYVCAEMFPLVKVGGLGDVAGSLPKALGDRGIDISVAIPAYSFLKKGIRLDMTDTEGFDFYLRHDQNVPIYLVDKRGFFEGNEIYYSDKGWERFAEFSRGAAILAQRLDVDIIHANDWHAALSVVYATESDPTMRGILSIHNIQYQGNFPLALSERLGIPNTGLICMGDGINFLLGGMRASDAVNVVSESYASEITTSEYGCGLEDHIKEFRQKLWGITNGIDWNVWDPEKDPIIERNYDVGNIFDKRMNKAHICGRYGLPVHLPLFGMVTRLAGQKGLDILMESIPHVMDRAGIIILGTGEEEIEERISGLSREYENLIALIQYDEAEAHKIYACADFFLMPSRFEPCGLGQLIAMRYGTIPVVRRTGGLIDTVSDVDDEGWGVTFDRYDPTELTHAMERAIKLYGDREKMKDAMEKAIRYDSSWSRSASKYIDMYRSVL